MAQEFKEEKLTRPIVVRGASFWEAVGYNEG